MKDGGNYWMLLKTGGCCDIQHFGAFRTRSSTILNDRNAPHACAVRLAAVRSPGWQDLRQYPWPSVFREDTAEYWLLLLDTSRYWIPLDLLDIARYVPVSTVEYCWSSNIQQKTVQSLLPLQIARTSGPVTARMSTYAQLGHESSEAL